MKTTRREVQQALRIAQSYDPSFKVNQTLKDLAARGFGHVSGQDYKISREERRNLKQWLQRQGISWQIPWSSFDGDRVQTAEMAVNEKLARTGAQDGRVLIATWGGGALLNGQPVPEWTGGYVSAVADSLETVECDRIVLVENLAAFTALHRLVGAFENQRLLAVYRGDPSRSSGQSWARDIADRTGIPLAAFVDFDPAGLAIALQVQAESILLPELSALDSVQGSAEDFTNQNIQWEWLRNTDAGPAFRDCLTALAARRQGFTQERMIGLGIPHNWVELNRGAQDGQ